MRGSQAYKFMKKGDACQNATSLKCNFYYDKKPVWWDEPTQRLYANQEPVGEGE
jgi:hypothetical protein